MYDVVCTLQKGKKSWKELEKPDEKKRTNKPQPGLLVLVWVMNVPLLLVFVTARHHRPFRGFPLIFLSLLFVPIAIPLACCLVPAPSLAASPSWARSWPSICCLMNDSPSSSFPPIPARADQAHSGTSRAMSLLCCRHPPPFYCLVCVHLPLKLVKCA